MNRGFAAIGLVRPKNPINVGSALRAAYAYDASLVAIEGDRSLVKSSQDTTKSHRHLPVLRGNDLFAMCPYGAIPIAVDLVEDAVPLFDFIHPQSAFYIFGPEDGTLANRHLIRCKHRIMIPTRVCMNLAATINVVLYDRMSKQARSSLGRQRAA